MGTELPAPQKTSRQRRLKVASNDWVSRVQKPLFPPQHTRRLASGVEPRAGCDAETGRSLCGAGGQVWRWEPLPPQHVGPPPTQVVDQNSPSLEEFLCPGGVL
ncbi:unnamed protein product [Boreogadus saida]